MDVDLVSYNTVISACAKAGLPDQAERVFAQLLLRYETTRDSSFRPDIISYNCLLNAFAIAGKTDKVGTLFRTMRTEGPAPTIHSYNDVLYAYSKSKHPEQAEEFLHWWLMEEQRLRELTVDNDEPDANFVRPVTASYNIVLHAMAQSTTTTTSPNDAVRRAKHLFRTMPVRDSISYTTIIAIFCKKLSGTEALDAVDCILQQAWEDPTMVVDTAFLSNVLYSVATVDEKSMPQFVERIVKDWSEKGGTIQPDIAVYNGLIYCWAKSNSRETGERVLEILNTLEHDPRFRPDTKTYTNVLDALKTSRGSEYVTAAEDILTRMETVGPAPTVQSYTALIMNYARSRLAGKAILAANVLTRMKQAGIWPNLISYNTVLNACEHTDSSDRVATEEALKVACLTFDEIRSSPIKANHVTYGSFLGALGNLMPPDSRQEIVRLVFRRCCLEGQASPLVLKKLRSAAVTKDRYRELLEGRDESRLPASWTCHVRDSPARHQS
jgi:pentatricopeptide repeat protein